MMLDNQEEKPKNVFIEAFKDCVRGTHPFVSFLLLIGIIQCLGWFYQLLTYSSFQQADILWIISDDFPDGLPGILIVILALCLSCSILYALINFVVLTIYLIKIPFKEEYTPHIPELQTYTHPLQTHHKLH